MNPFSEALFGVDNVVLFAMYNLDHSRSWKFSMAATSALVAAVTNHYNLFTCTVGKIFEISLPVCLCESQTPGA